MARPAKPDKRDRQLNIKLTMGELCRVRERATEAGLRATEFGRACLLAEGPHLKQAKSSDGAFNRLRLAQVSRLGNNLNQVARRLHELRMPAPLDLAPLLKDIRDALAGELRDDS